MLDDRERLVEALLFVSSEPVPAPDLAAAAGLSEPALATALADLDCHYQAEGHGIRVEQSNAGLRLVSAPELASLVARYRGLERRPRLSAAALDTLTIVAYRQPVTRATIEAIRGVGSEHVLSVLLNLGLIEEVGRADSIGRPVLHGTTPDFLAAAGLTAISDLPALDEATSGRALPE